MNLYTALHEGAPDPHEPSARWLVQDGVLRVRVLAAWWSEAEVGHAADDVLAGRLRAVFTPTPERVVLWVQLRLGA